MRETTESCSTVQATVTSRWVRRSTHRSGTRRWFPVLAAMLFVVPVLSTVSESVENGTGPSRQNNRSCAGTTCGAVWAAGQGGVEVPAIPTTGKTVKDFIPSGWELFIDAAESETPKPASGDLNKDKIADLAFIVVRKGDNPTWGWHEKYAKTPRPVVVLHGRSDGTFERACVSNGAIMNGSIGNDFALCAVPIAIKNGVLTINNGNGATAIENYNLKFRLQGGKYELIGFTNDSGNTRSGFFNTMDSNLNTGYTTVETKDGINMKTGAAKSTKKYAYYSLRAGLVSSAPGLDDAPKAEQPSVNLENKWNLVQGEKSWQGPGTFSGKLQGMRTKTDLVIRAIVTDKDAGDKVSVRLAGPKGKLIEPDKVEQKDSTDGGKKTKVLLARFAMSKLKQYKIEQYGRVTKGYDTLGLSVQLVAKAGSGTGVPKMILSTSADKEKHQGEIRLTKTVELATLENWDWKTADW